MTIIITKDASEPNGLKVQISTMARVRLDRRILHFNWRCYMFNHKSEVPADLIGIINYSLAGISILEEYNAIMDVKKAV